MFCKENLWRFLRGVLLGWGFDIPNVVTPKSKARVEEIWPKCYGKLEMPYTKLIAKEFALGIIVKKLGKAISWATFAKEINTNQRFKFFKQMEKLKLQRKELKGVKSM